MTVFLIVFFLANNTVHFTIELSEHGIYTDRRVSVLRIGKGWLVCSSSDNLILTLTPDGRLISKYDLSGNGPRELQNPRVLGYRDGVISIVSGDTRILSFDDHLKLLGEPGRIVHNDTTGNESFYWKGRLFHSGSKTSKYALYESSRGKNNTDILKGYFRRNLPDNYDPQEISQFRFEEIFGVRFIDGRFLVTPFGVSSGMDNYELLWFSEPMEKYDIDKADLVLQAPIEDQPVFMGNFKAFFRCIAHYPGGYVVMLDLKNPETQKLGVAFDFFTEQGGFIRRVFREDLTVIASRNSSDVFIIDQTDENKVILVPFTARRIQGDGK